MLQVMLFDEGQQAIRGSQTFPSQRKMRPVTQMTTAAYHRKIDTDDPAKLQRDKDVDILVTSGIDELFVQNRLQGADLIPEHRSLFEREALGSLPHPRGELIRDFGVTSIQK